MVKKLKANRPGVKTVKSNLPLDIIEANILTRLRVKTLIRFTAVCKSWYAIIHDPFFINTHHQIQKKYFNNLLLVDYRNDFYNYCIAVKDSCLMEQLSYDCSNLKPLKVVGYCDGIVCVFGTFLNMRTDRHISLWNPALGINKIVTSYYDQTLGSIPDHVRICVGFGYLNRTNDYKVIKFVNDSLTIKDVDIYSLTSDSWRKIELDGANQFLKDGYLFEKLGVYVCSCHGGTYCWLAHKFVHDIHLHRIIEFYMEDELFKEMSLPYTTDNHCKSILFIYKDSLAVLERQRSDACNIWVMKKEYGDCMSWTKICNFDLQHPIESVLGVIETEHMMLRCRDINIRMNKVIVIDIGKSQKKATSSIKGIRFLSKARRVSSFYESLALLKGVHSKNSCSN